MRTKPDLLSFRPNLESLGERIQPAVTAIRGALGGTVVASPLPVVPVSVIDGSIVIRGGEGADQAVVTHVSSYLTAHYKISLNGATYRVSDARVTSDRVVFHGQGGNDYFRNDTSLDGIAFALRTSAYGMGGDDTLIGDRADDYLIGGTGMDSLYGRDGDDTLDGGLGEDYLYGSRGNDTLRAGLDFSYNLLSGFTGNDILYGGYGDDTMAGDSGNDTMSGGYGNDFMDGGSGNDLLEGGSGNDKMYGGIGSDTMYGNSGDDYMHGGTEIDKLLGGDGNDTLNGGGDDNVEDALYGGAGRDTFYWERDFNPWWPTYDPEAFEIRDLEAIDIPV